MTKFSLVFFLTTFSLFAQNSTKTCEILFKVNALIQHEHFQPKPVNDSLSAFVFDSFMDNLDPDRNLFAKNEYQNLYKYRLLLDDYILESKCAYLDDFVGAYKVALERNQKILSKLQNENFSYLTKDTLKFSKKKFPFDIVATDLEKVWRKRLKYDILVDISNMSSNLDSLTQNFSKIEKTAKNKVFDTYSCKLSSILNSKNGLEYDLQNIFLNIFCSYFDPHTNYFSLDDKSSFLSGLSKSNYSLGLSVTLNDKDEIVIDEIVPSGPAAKTGKFDKDDIITKVSNNKGEEYLVSCASLEKIGELIFSDANQEILLTIQKKNGIILNVLVKKQLMKATENSVYSFIAQGETKIGYINIPSFYADFEENTNQGCADDVAKEIEKLKKDAIQGLVLDLRNNGGGSMEEATKLAGMFIDMGPVAIMADNKHTLNIIKDYNRGSVYDGPIVIIINGNSASASEFFSGVMQDYNRAIIVGSPSLGKASMQSILPIDDNRQEFVKLTIEKFYRITGESCQIKGVIPDITLPVLYQNIFPREESNKTALRYDILHTTAKFNPFPRTNIEKVIALSNARTKNNTHFNDITLANKEINAFYNNPKSSYLLSFKNVYKDTHKLDVLWKKIKILSENNTKCSILNTSYDIEKLESDAFLQDGNDYRIKEVKTNPYLDEAISIINDYNRLNK